MGLQTHKFHSIGQTGQTAYWCVVKEVVRLFSAVPTDTMVADVSAEKHTWRRDVAPLRGCHTSVKHTVTE